MPLPIPGIPTTRIDFEWYGGPFNPSELDADRIQKALARIATRRKRATSKSAR